jgi:hypothetical protein
MDSGGQIEAAIHDLLSGKEGVDLGGELEVPVRDSSDLMGREVDRYPLVDV